MSPRLLDLFCCQGGAAAGYARRGFVVDGVDQVRQPRYPFTFHQADALEFLAEHWQDYDAVHLSPPCQAYSSTRHTHGNVHPELVEPARELVRSTGLPYVMENVVGAPLDHPITLCGAAFGLTMEQDGMRLVLRRHRLFESNVWLTPVECECLAYKDRGYQVAGIYGGGGNDNRAKVGVRGGFSPSTPVAKLLLDTPWMNQKGVAQAIPPAYTAHLADDLLAVL